MNPYNYLGRHLGASIRYQENISGDWEPRERELTINLLSYIALNPSRVRDVKLMLRPLSAMLDDEAKECFRLAFTAKFTGEILISTHPFRVSIVSKDDEHNVEFGLSIYDESEIEAYVDSDERSQPFRAIAVIDYLRSIGIDVDNYLASGKAVERA